MDDLTQKELMEVEMGVTEARRMRRIRKKEAIRQISEDEDETLFYTGNKTMRVEEWTIPMKDIKREPELKALPLIILTRAILRMRVMLSLFH